MILIFHKLKSINTSFCGKYGTLWGAANEDYNMASRQSHACAGTVQQSLQRTPSAQNSWKSCT